MSFKSISSARLSFVVLLASQSCFTFASDKFIEPIMVNIPGGQVTMNTEENATKTPKTFNIKPFRMGKYEVTGAEFAKFLEGFRIVEDISDDHACVQPASRACKKLFRKSKFDRELARAQKAARKNF